MKTTAKRFIIAFLICMLGALAGLKAQTLTIKGKVQFEGEYTFEPVHIAIVNLADNTVQHMDKIKQFSADLPFNGEFLVIVSGKDYQPKAIYINTECTSTKNFKYLFEVNLHTKEVQDNIPLHAGGIYWNKKKGLFDYYLATN